MQSGDRWASVVCIDVDMKETKTVHRGVTEIWQDKTIFLRCDCGKEFEIPYRHFKGKRRTVDCGCGVHNVPERLEDRAKCAVSFYIELSNMRRLNKYAEEQGKSTSRASKDLVKLALKYLEMGGDPEL